MADNGVDKDWVYYSSFGIGDSASKYTLSVGGYKGDGGNSLSRQSGQKFTTSDSDNDNNAANCANTRGPGWHNNCCWACPFNDFTSDIWMEFQWGSQMA